MNGVWPLWRLMQLVPAHVEKFVATPTPAMPMGELAQ
jgi:hypothetical protein